MMTRPLGKTGFSIAPLVFGGNVFGWTAEEATSHRLLDALVGESENVMGRLPAEVIADLDAAGRR